MKTFCRPIFNRVSVIICACSLFFTACRENVILPSTLIPPVDNINTFSQDTFTIITNTVYQDSILTGGLRNSSQISASTNLFHALGTITSDPVFGKTNANIHVEVLPPVANFSFKTGTNRTIDSIIFSIPLKGAYGDTNAISNISQAFTVYRSLKAFPRNEAQYEFTKDSFDMNPVSKPLSISYAQLKDSPLVSGVKLVPQLRFSLQEWFIDSLEDQIDLGAGGAAADFTKFLAWWRGFYIKADNLNGNALYYLNTYGTRLSIYYRYTNTNAQLDTVVDVFSFDPNNCNRFNYITRDYSGKPANHFVNSIDPAGDSVLFLQNEPGLAAVVAMPYLDSFENVIVNQAELIFYAVSPYTNFSDTARYNKIPRLQIFQTDTALNGSDNVIPDYNVFGSNIVDGSAKDFSIGGLTFTRYKFAVTYAIQRLISEKNSTFRFKIMGLNNGFPAAYRVMLAGNTTKMEYVKPKLKIIYTKIIK